MDKFADIILDQTKIMGKKAMIHNRGCVGLKISKVETNDKALIIKALSDAN